jgi:hypothetical protein
VISVALSLILAAKGPPPVVPKAPDPSRLRVGIWVEAGPGRDSAASFRWSSRLVAELKRRVSAPPAAQSAELALFRWVPQGALPLAGGDARHHPDLRVTDLDLVWGLKSEDALDSATMTKALRTFFVNRGCLDERSLSVPWDLFRLPQLPSNNLSASQFPIDEHHSIHWPRWNLLAEEGLPKHCVRILALRPAGSGIAYSEPTKILATTARALDAPLSVRVHDALRHPALGAILELWRGSPDSTRPFSIRMEGPPATFVADDSGIFDVRSARSWLAADSTWTHGKSGSRGASFWRIRHAHKQLSGWLDAGDLLDLPLERDTLRLSWTMPAGSSRAWSEASSMWPRPWLAAQSDSSGQVTIGLSVPHRIQYVLRLVDARGKELFRSLPIEFAPGVYEKTLERRITQGDWDVRMDAPSSRLQVRLTAP